MAGAVNTSKETMPAITFKQPIDMKDAKLISGIILLLIGLVCLVIDIAFIGGMFVAPPDAVPWVGAILGAFGITATVVINTVIGVKLVTGKL